MGEVVTAPIGGSGPKGPIKEASSTTDSGDKDLVYDRDCFCKIKV
jgi:hypothetical protein